MAQLFNKSEYADFRSKVCSGLKKTLESKIEGQVEQFEGEKHPIELQEDILLDGAQFYLLAEGMTMHLPVELLTIDSLGEIFNMRMMEECFVEEEIEELLRLVPGGKKENLRYALEGKGIYEMHLENFMRKLKSGYFSSFREKEDEINEKLSAMRLKEIYHNLLTTIQHQRNNGVQREKLVDDDEGSSVESLNEFSEIAEMSENSQATETEEEIDDGIDEELTRKVFFRYDFSKVKNQEELLALGEDKSDRKTIVYKFTQPMRPRNSEWVENYRRQELLRYANPTKPWIYVCEDNRKVTVAPVAKKISVLTGKPRDHPMLKSERPACVTILTLVRDAAARLPNGVGTRADISELLKESQYVTEDLQEEKLSNIVSGALDRLHYMADACVKYDSEKKLWIYLHVDRNHEHPGWGEDGEEYTEKAVGKKKRNYDI